MKYQKELNLSVGLCRHSLATNGLSIKNDAFFLKAPVAKITH